MPIGVKAKHLTREEVARIHLQYRRARWRNLRKEMLAEDPYCAGCRRLGRVGPAQELHHLISPMERPDLFYERDNLEFLCRACHLSETARQKCVSPALDSDGWIAGQ